MQFTGSRNSNRQGIFIVLVMIILMVFAIMGVAIYSTGSTEYNHTMLVAYKLKADNLAQAVVEEALCVLYDKVNRPVDVDISDDAVLGADDVITNNRIAPPWKAELLEKIVAAAGDSDSSTEVGVLLSFDLLELGLVPESIALLEGQGCIIEECLVEFEGFRKIWSTKDGFFVKNRDVVYYKDPTGLLDEEDYKYPYPNDYQGYAVIKVKVSYGSGPVKTSRHLSSIHDIKVVNQTPMARRFAMCQWYPNPDQPTRDEDLNNGGGFKVFPNDKARLFVRGPYVTDTYGDEDGTGGRNPPSSINYWSGDWHGWSNIPSSRAGISKPRLANQLSPARPDDTSGKTLDLGIGGFTTAGGDPGYTTMSGQSWICASQPNTPENLFNAFGIMGVVGDIQTFEGILAKVVEGGEEGASAAPAGEWPLNPTDELEDLWVKRIEGQGLYQRCHQVEFSSKQIGLIIHYLQYDLKMINDNLLMPYACYFMPNIKPKAIGAWVGLIVSIIQVVAIVLSWGTATPAVLAMQVGSMMMTSMALDGMIAGFNDTSVGTQQYSPGLDASQFKGYFPPQYRDFPRLTTRWYYSLDDIPSYVQDDPEEFPILIDGSLYVQTFNEQRWFKYAGKGTLVSDNGAGVEELKNPTIEGPIMSVSGPTVDHLNLIYRGTVKDAYKGDDVLYVKSTPDNPYTFIDGSVFSVQGIAPADDTTSVTIGGNYLCGYFSKSKIPVDTEVVVDYNVNYKPEEDEKIEEFSNGHWHTASISFRSAGWYDRRRE